MFFIQLLINYRMKKIVQIKQSKGNFTSWRCRFAALATLEARSFCAGVWAKNVGIMLSFNFRFLSLLTTYSAGPRFHQNYFDRNDPNTNMQTLTSFPWAGQCQSATSFLIIYSDLFREHDRMWLCLRLFQLFQFVSSTRCYSQMHNSAESQIFTLLVD